uniref:Uncharacterized protein n=1 Tax=Rhizophora mucronata TaxID=61149 RepID=A0A2P2N037_RHIMU
MSMLIPKIALQQQQRLHIP